MKITILTNSKGGVFSFTTHLADQLYQRGIDFSVFFLEKSCASERFAIKRKRVFRIKNLTHFGFIPNFSSFVTFFFRDHPDLVHANFSTVGLLAVLKKVITNTPFILTLHGIPQPWFESSFLEKIKYTLETILLPYVASKASSIVAISNYVKEKLKTDFGLESEVIYNGTKSSKFESLTKQQIRKELGFAEKDFIGLFVGKLHPYKDPLTLIQAVKKVSQAKEDFHITIIGKGSLKRKVTQQILNLNLSKLIDLKESLTISDLHKHYAASDFFVLPSKNEAFGIVLLEAMAMGLPIIASDSGAPQEVVNGAGIYYKTGNSGELAKKIIILMQDKNLQLELSKIGPIRVAKSFSVENMSMKYFQLFKKVVQDIELKLK